MCKNLFDRSAARIGESVLLFPSMDANLRAGGSEQMHPSNGVSRWPSISSMSSHSSVFNGETILRIGKFLIQLTQILLKVMTLMTIRTLIRNLPLSSPKSVKVKQLAKQLLSLIKTMELTRKTLMISNYYLLIVIQKMILLAKMVKFRYRKLTKKKTQIQSWWLK